MDIPGTGTTLPKMTAGTTVRRKVGTRKRSYLKRCRELGRDEANRELPHQRKHHEESQGNHERPRSLHRLPPKERKTVSKQILGTYVSTIVE